MDLSIFKEQSLFAAMQSFFQELNIPVSEVTEDPADPQDLIGTYYKEDNLAHALIDKVYFLGMVNESAFDNEENQDTLNSIKDANEDFIEIIDKFNSPVTFSTSEVSTIQEKADGY